MTVIKAGLIQQKNSADIEYNRHRIADKIDQLSANGAKLIINQELHDSLYFCQTEDVEIFNLSISLEGDTVRHYSQLAKKNKVVIVTSLFEKRAPGLYHNTAVVFENDGSIAGIYRKMHIPDDPAYYEKFYFTPGDLGFRPIKTSLGQLGVLVCWDQWYPEAARLMTLAGADILIYPTAIGWTPSDPHDEKLRQLDAWKTIQRGHAIANGLPVITVNRVGFEWNPSDNGQGLEFWGNSFVSGPQGEILFEAPEDAESECIVDIDMSRSENVRCWWPFLRDRRIDAYEGLNKRFL